MVVFSASGPLLVLMGFNDCVGVLAAGPAVRPWRKRPYRCSIATCPIHETMRENSRRELASNARQHDSRAGAAGAPRTAGVKFCILAPTAPRELQAGSSSVWRSAMPEQSASTLSVWCRRQCANRWHAAPHSRASLALGQRLRVCRAANSWHEVLRAGAGRETCGKQFLSLAQRNARTVGECIARLARAATREKKVAQRLTLAHPAHWARASRLAHRERPA